MSIVSTLHNQRGLFLAISTVAALTLVLGCMPDKKTDDELAEVSKTDAGTSAPTDAGDGDSTTQDTTAGDSSTPGGPSDGGSTPPVDTSDGGPTTPADTSSGGDTSPKECTTAMECASKKAPPPCKVWLCTKSNMCQPVPNPKLKGTKCSPCPQKQCTCKQPLKEFGLKCLP